MKVVQLVHVFHWYGHGQLVALTVPWHMIYERGKLENQKLDKFTHSGRKEKGSAMGNIRNLTSQPDIMVRDDLMWSEQGGEKIRGQEITVLNPYKAEISLCINQGDQRVF